MAAREVLTRSEAKARGLETYFTGAPCKHGHMSGRRTRCGGCIACAGERMKQWYADNRENHIASVKTRNDANESEKRAYDKAWHAAAREVIRSGDKPRWKVDAHAKAAHNSKRRARKLNATPAWDADLTDFVAQEAAHLCALRAAATGFAWDVDHMIPLQARNACGLHVWSNLQVIPALFNRAKCNRMVLTEPIAWLSHA